MKEIQYRAFSLGTHKKNWQSKRVNVCQFELTFRCDLHCRHCYTACYNKVSYIKKELDTKEVKLILDKLYKKGIIWLCFSGGDPLTRKDFLELYSYAKNRGFIITIFTSGYAITKEIVQYLKNNPPFVIEMTLNAVTEDLYEKISQVKGSFAKVIQGIDLILKSRLPLKIKTQITKDNLTGLPKIKKFIKGLDLKFQSTSDLYARLNGDVAPCNLRISPQEVLNLNGSINRDCLNEDNQPSIPKNSLFHCAIGGGDGIYLDPYGNTFLCNLIRKPFFNLLKVDIEYALNQLLPLVRNRKFATNSKCKDCKLKPFCRNCPGRAHLETGDMESPIPYYCDLTHAIVKRNRNPRCLTTRKNWGSSTNSTNSILELQYLI